MRTETIKIFKYNELPNESKEAAINSIRERNFGNDEWMINDAMCSLNEFCLIFPIEYKSIDFSMCGRSEWSVTADDDYRYMSSHRLAKYIWNNYKYNLFSGKYYSNSLGGDNYRTRKSNIILDHSCELTGMCYDDDLLAPIYDFLDNPADIDFEDLLGNCISNLLKAVASEIEYNESDKGIEEYLSNHSIEFTRDGEIYYSN